MRTWIGAVGLAAVTAGGVAFIANGTGEPNHCGPCVAGTCPAATPTPEPSPVAPAMAVAAAPAVIDLIDLRDNTRRSSPGEQEVIVTGLEPAQFDSEPGAIESPAPARIPMAVDSPF